LPSPPPSVDDITGLTISTDFGGGISGDNWNVNKVALVVSFPTGSAVHSPPRVITRTWLDASSNPLVRFTGKVHDLSRPVSKQDVGLDVDKLSLLISTGNDDLRGGSKPNDNCDVTVALTSGQDIVVNNANGGQHWENWTDHMVTIPLPAIGLKGGDVKFVALHTAFGGGLGGDNWNVNRIQLLATLK
jgi:hypothetical protein